MASLPLPLQRVPLALTSATLYREALLLLDGGGAMDVEARPTVEVDEWQWWMVVGWSRQLEEQKILMAELPVSADF